MKERDGNTGFWKLLYLVILGCLFLLFLGNNRVHAGSAEDLIPKKIVSIVYDDSGSMETDERFAKANYAIQAFLALMNGQDRVFITYMSNPENAVEVNLNRTKEEIENLRGIFGNGGTPLQSVDTAAEKLFSISAPDEDTQYWLVVFTDGDPYVDSAYGDSFQEVLDYFAGKKAPNGSQIHISFMQIGDFNSGVSGNGSNFVMKMAKNANEILDTLQEISGTVSGRLSVDSSNMKVIDSKTIEVSFGYPLYSIAVFSQNSSAEVVKAEIESPLKVERNISLHTPEIEGFPVQNVIVGNAALISNNGGVIESGKCKIQFSEEISSAKITVLMQPAIELGFEILHNNKVIPDPSVLEEKDVIDVRIYPINPATGEEIDPKDLPAGTTWEIKHSTDQNENTYSQQSTQLTVELGTNKISGFMSLPGMLPLKKSIVFDASDSLKNLMIDVTDDDKSFERGKLKTRSYDGELLTYWILQDRDMDGDGVGDGNPVLLDAETCNGRTLAGADPLVEKPEEGKWYDRFGFIDAKIYVVQNPDGSFSAFPVAKNILVSIFTPYLITPGKYTSTLEIVRHGEKSQITAPITFTVTANITDWIPLGIEIIVLIFSCYLCYLLFIRNKFSRGITFAIEVYSSTEEGDGKGVVVSGMGGNPHVPIYGDHFWNPGAAEFKVPHLPLTVKADNAGVPYFDEYEVNGVWGGSIRNPEKMYDKMINELRALSEQREKEKKAAREVDRNVEKPYVVSTNPIYFYNESEVYSLRVK